MLLASKVADVMTYRKNKKRLFNLLLLFCDNLFQIKLYASFFYKYDQKTMLPILFVLSNIYILTEYSCNNVTSGEFLKQKSRAESPEAEVTWQQSSRTHPGQFDLLRDASSSRAPT